ncbi:MAG: HIT family protein [Thermoplasmata archaeon]|nr:HIT family protein [Thermoplasmata archaeon]MCI4359350.1 HIT family protein [Thermoplasmata archaeon]
MSTPPADEVGCPFCEIVHRRSPAHTFYEDDEVMAFLDLFPYTRGHALVVPKRHVDRLTDLPEEEYREFLRGLANVCRRMDRLSQHYNVALNQGSRAGQVVFHLHVHVIPRYGEENPFATRPRARLDDVDARALLGVLGTA